MAPRYLVGVDLGTTHTVVAWAALDAPDAVHTWQVRQPVSPTEVAARPLLPSALYAPLPAERDSLPGRDRAEPYLVGLHAARRGAEVPGRLVASAKSWLTHGAVDRTAPILPWGSDDASVPRLSPVDAAARLLGHVRADWDADHPDAPLAAQALVVTVPASFDAAARELTLGALERAGLGAQLLEEPQAAFYDWMRRQGDRGLDELLAGRAAVTVLVCDVGGGTTDFSLIAVERTDAGPAVRRLAVGDHLLLGGDNMDLALAHLVEPRLSAEGAAPGPLPPARFAQLVAACRATKERLLGDDPPDEATVTLLGEGSRLLGGARRAVVRRDEAERLLLDGFWPVVGPDASPTAAARGALTTFGLPYARDPAITRHLAAFLRRHGEGGAPVRPDAVVLNGGVFHGRAIAERLGYVLAGWAGGLGPRLLPYADPDLAVARGAVAFGLAQRGLGRRIGGGSARAYYVGAGESHALCLVPRGAEPGQVFRPGLTVGLLVGKAARFELLARSDASDAPGTLLPLDAPGLTRLPPLVSAVEASRSGEVPVQLEGALTELGTLEVTCVEQAPGGRRFRLAFALRHAGGDEARAPGSVAPPSRPPGSVPPASPAPSSRPPGSRPPSVVPASGLPPGLLPPGELPPSLLPAGLDPRASSRPPAPAGQRRVDAGLGLLDRVYGKSGHTTATREVKDLVRDLERALGERPSWTAEVGRELFDHLLGQARARRRSPEHERQFWLLAGYTLRPGVGHPGDAERVRSLAALWPEGVQHRKEARVVQQFWIAFRRVAAGLDETTQGAIRDALDVHLQPDPPRKVARPEAFDDLMTLASWLERAPRKDVLGGWLVERTWTSTDPRLWEHIGRLGARVPVYASAHHVLPPRVVEPWVDELLRARWGETPTAALAATRLVRRTGDRARDVSERARREVLRRLEATGARPLYLAQVSEVSEPGEGEAAEAYGEALPAGLRLV